MRILFSGNGFAEDEMIEWMEDGSCMVGNSLVEGIACLPIMAGFEGVLPRGADVGVAEGWEGNLSAATRARTPPMISARLRCTARRGAATRRCTTASVLMWNV